MDNYRLEQVVDHIHSDRGIWHVITALRGPDRKAVEMVKWVFNGWLRHRVLSNDTAYGVSRKVFLDPYDLAQLRLELRRWFEADSCGLEHYLGHMCIALKQFCPDAEALALFNATGELHSWLFMRPEEPWEVRLEQVIHDLERFYENA